MTLTPPRTLWVRYLNTKSLYLILQQLKKLPFLVLFIIFTVFTKVYQWNARNATHKS
uniref:Uncharacterized protein n=1 Tax=Rhizophora mucronata TaxID=61149 RepID=A0A2P2NQ62_RHIMU